MRGRAIKLCLTATLMVAGAAITGLVLGGWDFLSQHFAPLLVATIVCTLFVTFAISTVRGVVRGAVLAVRRPRAMGESGSAFGEFVIVIIPFLFTLTALMQLALASLARVLVSYAAFAAARAAIVIVPLGSGDLSPLASKFAGENRNMIGPGSDQRLDYMVSGKAGFIRNAAAYVMIPASPSIDIVVEDTAHNWGNYWQNRVQAGVSPLDVVVDGLGQILRMPDGQQQQFDQQVRDIMAGGISTPAEKAAADAKIEALVQTLPPDQQAQAKSQLENYVKNYTGNAQGAPGDGSSEWMLDNVNNTMQGPLAKYRDALLGMYWSARGNSAGNQAGDFRGYTVDRAMDAGFGADVNGAGGAILRTLRKFLYAKMGTVVILQDKNGKVRSRFAPTDPITAKVTHLYYCQIPLANKLAGKPFYDLPLQTQLDMTTGALGYGAAIGIPGYFMSMTATHTLANQGRP